ncbi:MAG: T9SS type A sorting domain-containing protein, partial [Bacteroidota bacterium]
LAAARDRGPRAHVLFASTLTGSARSDGCALVATATIAGIARVLDNAVVRGGVMRDSAIVRDQSLAENNTLSGSALLGGCSIVQNYKLGGSVIIDGDLVVYNDQGECNTGEYHVLTQYYRNELLPCGERDAKHPENISVNRPMRFDLVSVDGNDHAGENLDVFPNPATGDEISVRLPSTLPPDVSIEIVDVLGRSLIRSDTDKPLSQSITVNVRALPRGWFSVRLTSRSGSVFAHRSLLKQ